MGLEPRGEMVVKEGLEAAVNNTSADSEIQKTLMERLSQQDGFEVVGKVSAGASAPRKGGCSFSEDQGRS